MSSAAPYPASEHVRLRPITEADIGQIYDLQFDEEGAKLAGVPGRFLDADRFHQNMLENVVEDAEKATVFTIRVEGAFAGYIGLFESDVEGWRVSYWLARAFWGKGIGYAALAALIANLPAAVKGCPLTAAVIESNQASRRILTKCGFKPYGEQRFFCAAHKAEKIQVLYRKQPA